MSDVIRFDSNEIAQSFRANQEKRTVSGLALRWGEIADNGVAKWRFQKGSLHWTATSRVKLDLNHDRHQAIGVANRIEATPVGLDMTFKVARGEEGDRALAMAEDGVLDGFSIEIDFMDGDDWIPDPNERSVRLVRSATLRGVALTAFPAFDSARVESVVAHKEAPQILLRKESPQMANNEENEKVNEDLDKPASEFERKRAVEFTREVLKDVLKENTEALAKAMENGANSMSSAFTAALEKIDAPQHQKGSVRAARFALDREPPVYNFNGIGPSLMRDAWYASQQGGRDPEATARISKYREQAQFAVEYQRSQFFNINTTDQGDIINPGYRADLYVGELVKGRPIINLLSRGQLANATPFTVPVFATKSNATNDHAEGTHPTHGDITFDTKTITPVAISGAIQLTREMVDSSNPAIDQIAFAAMRESYNAQTEGKAYTMINGTSGVGGVITSTLVPSGGQADVSSGDGNDLLLKIRDRLAVYPFRRFASPSGAVMSQEATTLLAVAQSAEDGRFQLPSVGASNSAGVGNAVQQGWSIDGLPFVPAWAMSGNAAGDSDVIIINAGDAWAWESSLLQFRFEEKYGPEMIEVALFGYFATHVLRPVGLSGIRHTAS